MTENRRKITSLSLLLMTFSAVFSFPNIINNSIQIGLRTIPAFLFGSIFYFLPFALMVGEFASANHESESGIHSWIRNSLGEKWAFLGAWSYFFVNMLFSISLVPSTLIYTSYTFFGGNVFGGNKGTLVISILSVIVFWIITYIGMKGISWMSKVTNVAGVAKIFMGIVFIILAFVIVYGFKNPPAQEFTYENITPNINWTFFMTMAWILQAFAGNESIGVYVANVKGGNRVFIKTMIISTIVIGGLYILGCIALGFIVPEEVLHNNFSNGIFDVFSILGGHFGVSENVITRIVGLILMLSNLGSLVIWSTIPVKVLFSEIPEGIFGKWITKTNKEGNPKNALIVQATVATIFLLIPAFGIGSLDNFLETLINMTASTTLIPTLFLIIAYIVLRYKKDDMKRSFKMGSRKFGIFVGVVMLILFLFVFFMSTVPDPVLILQALNGTLPEGEGNPILIFLYNVSGLIIFLGFALVCWNKHVRKLSN